MSITDAAAPSGAGSFKTGNRLQQLRERRGNIRRLQTGRRFALECRIDLESAKENVCQLALQPAAQPAQLPAQPPVQQQQVAATAAVEFVPRRKQQLERRAAGPSRLRIVRRYDLCLRNGVPQLPPTPPPAAAEEEAEPSVGPQVTAAQQDGAAALDAGAEMASEEAVPVTPHHILSGSPSGQTPAASHAAGASAAPPTTTMRLLAMTPYEGVPERHCPELVRRPSPAPTPARTPGTSLGAKWSCPGSQVEFTPCEGVLERPLPVPTAVRRRGQRRRQPPPPSSAAKATPVEGVPEKLAMPPLTLGQQQRLLRRGQRRADSPVEGLVVNPAGGGGANPAAHACGEGIQAAAAAAAPEPADSSGVQAQFSFGSAACASPAIAGQRRQQQQQHEPEGSAMQVEAGDSGSDDDAGDGFLHCSDFDDDNDGGFNAALDGAGLTEPAPGGADAGGEADGADAGGEAGEQQRVEAQGEARGEAGEQGGRGARPSCSYTPEVVFPPPGSGGSPVPSSMGVAVSPAAPSSAAASAGRSGLRPRRSLGLSRFAAAAAGGVGSSGDGGGGGGEHGALEEDGGQGGFAEAGGGSSELRDGGGASGSDVLQQEVEVGQARQQQQQQQRRASSGVGQVAKLKRRRVSAIPSPGGESLAGFSMRTPGPGGDAGGSGPLVRRSRRQVHKPLQYWAGEKKIYARQHRSLPTVDHFETHTPAPEWEFHSDIRRRGEGRKRARRS